ncbi:effector-associated domain EAD1-containing protein [Spirillospora sp. CA-255316]
MTGENAFTRTEVMELAKVFPPLPAARSVLREAGFPEVAIPAAPDTALGFWEQVSESIANGVVRDGRRKILAAALRRYPANAVLATPAVETTSSASFRVLVVGASPRGTDRIRWDRELKAISAADRGHLVIQSCPAASVLDLDRIRTFRPDLLHLICHGVGEDLVFEDPDGEPHPVPAEDVADTIARSREHEPLRGLLLRSCHSEHIAGLFTRVSNTVIAHRGPLDDTCGTLFADRLYRELINTPDLHAAAWLAAREAANADQACRSILTDLIVLPARPIPPGS